VIYAFDENAGDAELVIKGELHKYLIKVRRHKEGERLAFRNKRDTKTLYTYEVREIEPRTATLELLSSHECEVRATKELHIAWCIIDPKSVEKVLATLCEIGVSRISFISCERSQNNFKPDIKRFERIVEASMQQSGRTDFMVFDTYKSIATFLKEYPDTKVFDFTESVLGESSDFKRVLIGCEGGFSAAEKELCASQEVFRLNSQMVLRSESAVVAVASKIVL